jgi:DNA-directed RNA polymerase subunit RPC12/RpoP
LTGTHDFVDPRDLQTIADNIDNKDDWFFLLLLFLLQSGWRISEGLGLNSHSFTNEVSWVCSSCKTALEARPESKLCPSCGGKLLGLVKIVKERQRQKVEGKDVMKIPKRGSTGESWISGQLAKRICGLPTKTVMVNYEGDDGHYEEREVELFFSCSRQNVWKRIRRAYAKAGIEKTVSPHDFRSSMVDKISELAGPGSSLPSEVIHHRSQRTLDKSLDGYRRRQRDKNLKVPIIASWIEEIGEG